MIPDKLQSIIDVVANDLPDDELLMTAKAALSTMVKHWKGPQTDLCDALREIITKATEKHEHIHLNQ